MEKIAHQAFEETVKPNQFHPKTDFSSMTQSAGKEMNSLQEEQRIDSSLASMPQSIVAL